MAEDLARHLDLDLSVRLWDGTLIPLGSGVSSDLAITIAAPGVISSLLRRPTLDRLIRHYAHGQIGFEGGTLIDVGERLASGGNRKRLKQLSKRRLIGHLWPFLFAPATKPERSRDYAGDAEGAGRFPRGKGLKVEVSQLDRIGLADRDAVGVRFFKEEGLPGGEPEMGILRERQGFGAREGQEPFGEAEKDQKAGERHQQVDRQRTGGWGTLRHGGQR